MLVESIVLRLANNTGSNLSPRLNERVDALPTSNHCKAHARFALRNGTVHQLV